MNKKETSSVEQTYEFIATADKYAPYLRMFVKVLMALIWVLAITLLLLNALYFLRNQKYLEIQDTSIPFTQLEFNLLIGGGFSAIFVVISLIIFANKVFSWIMTLIRIGINRLFTEPVGRLYERTTKGILASKLWLIPYGIGQNVGYKYIVYPALHYLEPDTDRNNLELKSIEQLPPLAYTDENYCTASLERYFRFASRVSPLTLLCCVVILLFAFYIVLSPIALLGKYLPEFLQIALILGLTFGLMLAWISFTFGIINPFIIRRRAWATSKQQIINIKELEKNAENIHDNIVAQLLSNIDNLNKRYEKDTKITQQARIEREQFTTQLRHLVEQPNVDSDTLKIVLSLLESLIDQRKKTDEIIQEQQVQISRKYDLKKDIIIGIVFLFLGTLLSKCS